MVGSDGALPLPWLATPLQRALQQQAHALLLHGPRGVGQFDLALTLAQAWLCEAAAPGAARPCGVCGSCRLVQSHGHPDLLVLLPQALVESLGWAAGADGDEAGSEKVSKAKPSKEIKVDAVRACVAFAQTTSARGRGKVVVVHPAEQMNVIAANTMLKTLEEPPGQTRFVLSCALPEALPPTIRSRCQAFRLALPEQAESVAWLRAQGVAQPEVLLAAAGGQPLEALAWVQQGIDAALWLRLPSLVAQGQSAPVAAWPLALLVDALQKVCHDALSTAVGAAPRYFTAASLGPAAATDALSAWSQALRGSARHAEHPWNAPLMVEALLRQGQRALASRPGKQGISVH